MNLIRIVINCCQNYKFCYQKLIKGISKLILKKLRDNELAAVFYSDFLNFLSSFTHKLLFSSSFFHKLFLKPKYKLQS